MRASGRDAILKTLQSRFSVLGATNHFAHDHAIWFESGSGSTVTVNRVMGDPASQLRERHDAGDFATKTQDKVGK